LSGRFTSLLIANRGEIACRIIAAARNRGLRTIAVYSDADAQARHVALADEAVRIGPPLAALSYLSIDAILAAARASGAQAVHPGYGFLSENAAFAEACQTAGLAFVGPPASAIAAMGNKAAAKRLMLDAGVPCVPGYHGAAQDDVTLVEEAHRIGFPLMVKAAAGGGGRGMRLVGAADNLAGAITSARSEAQNAFGSTELILERAILGARHVEIQVMADQAGATIHFGERDCSLQRRHQKVIEEAPSPAVDAELRARMGEVAVTAARAIDYVGAGTVELLLGDDGGFYFLEMNTRIQVEHPVTEMITGLDLVGMQIDVAMGMPLALDQNDVVLDGHAIEARLYAEDPASGFFPQAGRVIVWAPAQGEGVRTDHGILPGATVGADYDPMLAKIIAHGRTREEARARLIAAIGATRLLGVVTNKGFLIDCLEHPVFAAGDVSTDFLDRAGAALTDAPDHRDALAAAAVLLASGGRADELAGWSSTGTQRTLMTLRTGDRTSPIAVSRSGADWMIEEGGDLRKIDRVSVAGGEVTIVRGARALRFAVAHDGDVVHLDDGRHVHRFEDLTYRAAERDGGGGDGTVRAPMNGLITTVNVAPGDAVTKDSVLLVLEAMKMEQPLLAGIDGIVETVAVVAGDQVATRQTLVTLLPAPGTGP